MSPVPYSSDSIASDDTAVESSRGKWLRGMQSTSTNREAAASQRKYFGIAFGLSLLMLLYASILPVRYVPMSIEDAQKKFLTIPWLDIGLYGRADWAANMLVMLPVGWLAAASIDWGRRSQRLLQLMLPLVISFLSAFVVTIEFVQAWFPIRTQSLNDIAAGCVGGFLGAIIWLTIGRVVTRWAAKVASSPVNVDRLWYACLLYMLANLAYAAIPMDIILSLDELEQKIAEGRLYLFPSFEIPLLVLKPAILAALRVLPLALMLCFAKSVSLAVIYSFGLALACEIIQVPIYSRDASLFDVIASSVGIGVAVFLFHFRRQLVSHLRHPVIWILAGSISMLFLVLAVLIKAEGFVVDSGMLRERWVSFWDWPFAKYYYQPEYQALSTILYKTATFGWVGCCFGLAYRLTTAANKTRLAFSSIFALIIGAAVIELLQIFLLPHIPDFFDIVFYGTVMLVAAVIVNHVKVDFSSAAYPI